MAVVKFLHFLVFTYCASCHALLSFNLAAGNDQSQILRYKSVCSLNLKSNQNVQDLVGWKDRREFTSSLIFSVASTLAPIPSNAVDLRIAQDEPLVTHTVIFNVRISRSDGTFYTKSEPEEPNNEVFTGKVSFGLYGNLAPVHVSRFLEYVDVLYSPADENQLPSYARSQFPSLDQSTGLLTGGFIPGLHLTNFAGSSALEYGGRIFSSRLWIDDVKNKRVSHTRAGLLTHRDLDVLPVFGITTRDERQLLDTGYTVFGTLLPTDSSADFLSRCIQLPTYSLDRPAVPIGGTRATEEVASSFYSFQKDLFRSAAKTFGDARLDNVYEGKLLRRVEVTSVSWEKLSNGNNYS